MRTIQDFNAGWLFEGEQVRLPHTAVELPFNYFDERAYQRPFTYEKRFASDPAWEEREVSVVFDGAMANAEVSLNGERIARHPDGYTPFEARLTGRLAPGENLLTVTIDGSENPSIPPFGARIDYLTYAGLYREAWLRCTAPVHVESQKIETPDALAERKTVTVAARIGNPQDLPAGGTLTAEVLDPGGTVRGTARAEVRGDSAELRIEGLEGLALWDVDAPVLHRLRLTLDTPHGTDVTETRFGFRTAAFTPDGFMLNGRPLKIRGLNRHQSFPYAGYALGKAAQIADADILKRDLRLNLARTSHYPQSVHFLDRCDEIGLLVFEEIPGWQHIGGPEWKAEAVENVRRMIRRDWNHPSIVLWGTRINESGDDHDFYSETNRVARALDPTRQTGGVRCHAESEFLEDVYTMNDFVLGEFEIPHIAGNRPRTALRPQRETTGLARDVPYLVTEYNGHMFPTKSTDQEQRQAEHVTRHLEVLNAAYGDPGVSGAVGWCAFDYNTHMDFGSGDRICYHGVMDMFREPKFAAHVYASQDDPERGPVLEPVTLWSRGERNIEGVLPLIVLTNCDEVEFTYGDYPPVRIEPDRDRFPHLPHPPVIAEYSHFEKSALGGWGAEWQPGLIRGFVGGTCVAERRYVPDPVPTTLSVVPDATRIGAHDAVRVMIRALDQAGNKLRHLADPVSLSLEGPARLYGPEAPPLRAGSTGLWLRAEGPDEIRLTVRHARFAPQTVSINAEAGA